MNPRQAILITGPPCAGKSYYVDSHAAHNDLVVCFDRLARQAGSTRRHSHDEAHLVAARYAYRDAVADVPEYEGNAWVIRCAPDADERQALADAIGADRVLVLMPALNEALARARRDRRSKRTLGVIRRWYDRYTPRDEDEVITGDDMADRLAVMHEYGA